MDFMSDEIGNCRAISFTNNIDDYNRKELTVDVCLALTSQ